MGDEPLPGRDRHHHPEHRARAIAIGERLEVLKDYPTPAELHLAVRPRLDRRDGRAAGVRVGVPDTTNGPARAVSHPAEAGCQAGCPSNPGACVKARLDPVSTSTTWTSHEPPASE